MAAASTSSPCSPVTPRVFSPQAGDDSRPDPSAVENAHTFLQPDLSTETGTAEAGFPIETKHAGITAGRRVFVGPSFEGQGRKGRPRGASIGTPGASGRGRRGSIGGDAAAGKGKWKARDVSEDWDDANARVFASWRKDRRASPSTSTRATSQTVQSAAAMRGRKGSVGAPAWTGCSFEVGADVRELARRRDERLKREREAREEAERREEEAGKRLEEEHEQWASRNPQEWEEEARQTWDKQRRASAPSGPLRSPNVTLGSASFVTARTRMPSVSNAAFFRRPSDSSYLAFPPSSPDPKRPALHIQTASDALVASPANMSFHSANDEVEELSQSSGFLAPLRGILRSKDRTAANGSALGNGHPQTPSLIPHAPSARPRYDSNAPSHPAPSQGPNVRFPEQLELREASGAQPPASPAEVLARADSRADAAPESYPPQPPLPKEKPDDVIKTARMLVKVDWSQRDDLPDAFDEHVARKFPTSGGEAWQELGVVWRRGGWIELWDESRFGGFFSHKKLKAVIPLRPKSTHLSLYSSTDLIFCLTHRTNTHGIFSRSNGGTTSASALAATTATGSASLRRVTTADEEKDDACRRAPHSKASKRGYVHLRSSGTNIFLFRARTHSSAKEWMWELYLGLGGTVPRRIEVTVPGLGAKLRLPVPRVPTEDGEGETWAPMYPKDVVDRCVEQLGNVREWKELVEDAKRQGADFRLAWRRGSILDWIRDDDLGTRDWIVIGGGAVLRQDLRAEPVLELRPAAHYPTTCRIPAEATANPSKLSTTVRISEPPGIEGFLIRQRNNGASERVYLSSRMGLLFLCRPSTSHPPEPPISTQETLNNPAAIVLAPFIFGMASLAAPSKRKKLDLVGRATSQGGVRQTSLNVNSDRERAWTLKSMDAQRAGLGTATERAEHDLEDKGGEAFLAWLEQEEKRRAFLQITDARGFVHLSELESIEPELDDEDAKERWLQVEDLGGDEGLQAAEDKTKLKKMRSFVVKTRSGVSVKFECHSIDVREEMVERLRALATYWRRRERVDAIQLMELSPSSGLVNRLPPPRGHSARRHAYEAHPEDEDDGEPPPTRSEILSSSHLTHLYNWCILDGCRALMKESVMHVKKGLRGTFRLRNVLLLPGTLVEYQSIARDMHGQPLPSPYHRRRAVVSLRDVYVYSGSLASSYVAVTNSHNWNPGDESEHQFPRCYPGSDGLRTADEAEDCTFVLVRMKHAASGKNQQLGQKGTTVRVYRTRSKLERDQFVYAINAAIESVLRGESEREDHLRDFSSFLSSKR
ncbi:hypothetical protein JCM8547_004941 [Rhodosporidiobolus lusitaniae]